MQSSTFSHNETLPDPLVPADVDLRGYEHMPLYGEKLLRSDTWLSCSDRERVACIYIWWSSWQQVPASSLPDDDRLLHQLAGPGVTLSQWRRMRARVLHGYIPCSDGRLYHPLIAECALRAWDRHDQGPAGRQRRWRERVRELRRRLAARGVDAPVDAGVDALERLLVDAGVDAAVDGTVDGVRRHRDRDRDITSTASTVVSNADPQTPTAARALEPAIAIAVMLREHGCTITAMDPRCREWAAAGLTPALAIEAIERARQSKPEGKIPAGYLSPIIADLLRPPEQQCSAQRIPWHDIDHLAAYGQRIGCTAQPGEPADAYRSRLRAHLAARARATPAAESDEERAAF